MKLLVLFFSIVVLSSTGCDKVKNAMGKFKSKTAEQTENSGNKAEADNSGEVKGCSADSAIKEITGTCTGSWSFVQNKDHNLCVFTYSKQVNCPDGMGTQAAGCVGDYRIRVDVNSEVLRSAADCEKEMSDKTKITSYTLRCCNN